MRAQALVKRCILVALLVALFVQIRLYHLVVKTSSRFVAEETLLWGPLSVHAGGRQQPHTITSNDDSSKEQNILLISYVFGTRATHKKYLRMFVESARTSGVDIALVGNYYLPFLLPPNIRHIHIDWNQFVDRVAERIYEGEEPGDLRTADFYKVIDFKPLFAHLFPEEVQGYDWWGHIDNDMVLGNVRRFITPSVLNENDIISAHPNKTFGPFTLYRNTNQVNELFRLAEQPLKDIFATKNVMGFDEWGGGDGWNGTENKNYYSTMSGIIDQHRKVLELRWHGYKGIAHWDGDCIKKVNPFRCSECVFTKGELVAIRQRTKVLPKEVLLCHYQHGKQFLEESLEDQTKLARILEEGKFRVSHPEGFDFYDTTTIKTPRKSPQQLSILGKTPVTKFSSLFGDTLDIKFAPRASKSEYFATLPPYEAGEASFLQLGPDLGVLVGGYAEDYSKVTKILQFFNITSKVWDEVALPNKIGETHQAVAFDKTGRWVYVVSGQLGAGCLPPVSTVMRIHADSRQIQILPPLPLPRYAPSAVVVPVADGTDTYLHVFGGVSEDRRSISLHHWRLDVSSNLADIASNVWETQQHVPDAGLHAAAAYNENDGYIYYTGFCANDFAVMVNSSDMAACLQHDRSISDAHHVPRNGLTVRFATSNARGTSMIGHWERLEDMPLASCHSGTTITAYNRMILFGGVQAQPVRENGPVIVAHNVVQAFNIQTLSWEVMSFLPESIKNGIVWIEESGAVKLFKTGEHHRPGKHRPYSKLLKGHFVFDRLPPQYRKELLQLKVASQREHTERLLHCLGTTLKILCHTFWQEDYELVRMSWNHLYDDRQRPNIICFPRNTNEASALVKCARRSGQPICARNGKHSFSGDTCSDGIVVDVAKMNAIGPLDNDRTTWRLGAGNHLGRASFELYNHGIVLPTGHCPSVGLTGFTLVGGQGPLSRLYGMTSDYVKAVEYVNFEGELVLATEENKYSNALWLARGGGTRLAFPGIVTSWHFYQLPEVETKDPTEEIWTEITVHWPPTLENAQAVMSGWQDFLLDIDSSEDPLASRLTVEAWIAMFHNGKHRNAKLQKILRVTAFFYGTEVMHNEASERIFPRLQQLAGPNILPRHEMRVERMTEFEFKRKLGGVATNEELVSGHHGWDLVDNPPGQVNRWKGYSAVASDIISAEAVRHIVHGMWEAKPLTKRYTEFKPLKGAIQTKMNKTATAFWHRDALTWSVSSHFWHARDTPEHVDAVLRNSKKTHKRYKNSLGSNCSGSYAGYMEHSNSIIHDLQRYYGGNAEKVAKVRHDLDPHNVFRHFLSNRVADIAYPMKNSNIL